MLYLLDNADPLEPFPPTEDAEQEPNGLLAVGGDLTPQRLLRAYHLGIFPWFTEDQPILWWSPNPRMVLVPAEIRVSRSLRKTLRKNQFQVSMDQAFDRVIRNCAEPRDSGGGTWLIPQMIEAYERLHRLGYAHSVETWHDNELVGGLYGVNIGQVFFGESMFSRMSNASKVALAILAARARYWGFPLIDCQVHTEHLERLGARNIDRAELEQVLTRYVDKPAPRDWDNDSIVTSHLSI